MKSSFQKSVGQDIDQALTREPADLVIKNATILSVTDGSLNVGDIAIRGQKIIGTHDRYHGKQEIDGRGLFAVPGFIDTHCHIESTLVSPHEYDRLVTPRGTTTVVCDPHEICNVVGEKGLKYFLESARHTVTDLFVQLSSCVPATSLETAGAKLGARTLAKYKDDPYTLGLAEFMDIGGVLNKNPATLAKLAAFQGHHIDGHLPNITGFALNAMMCCGVRNCHESTGLDEAVEKLRKGLIVLIREGTAAKNLSALVPLIRPFTASRIGFATDDRKPTDLIKEGGIDHIIRNAIAQGADPASVYRIASLSAAEGFGLRDRGVIGANQKADIVLLRNLETCDIHTVIKNGQPVTNASFSASPFVEPVGYDSVKIPPVTPQDFVIPGPQRVVNVIGLIPNQIVTQALRETPSANHQGELVADPSRDLLKMAVLERHGHNGNIARCFVKGFGFKEGAIASTHGHDSHNITVVGTDDASMALAVNRIRDLQGGFVLVHQGQVKAEVPLPIAGLMSDKPGYMVAEELNQFNRQVTRMGASVENPILHLAFLSLCVIPTLKLTDHGLTRFDPAQGDLGPVLIDDQRLKRSQSLTTSRRPADPSLSS